MAGMALLRTAHTADLDPATLASARALLYDVFDDMTDDDWEHALGGVHALIWAGPELVGHGSVVQRRLVYRGRALRTGYVEGVGVRADQRNRGHGSAIMTELERVVRNAYDLGALGATDEAVDFYSASWLAALARAVVSAYSERRQAHRGRRRRHLRAAGDDRAGYLRRTHLRLARRRRLVVIGAVGRPPRRRHHAAPARPRRRTAHPGRVRSP